MIHSFKILFILSFVSLFLDSGLLAQPWSLAKENNGIKVYTRLESGSVWKSFKGEVTVQATIGKVCLMLGTDKHNDWWDKAITDIKVLGYEKNKYVQYYMIYNTPWPLTNRDIVTETRITIDTLSGIRIYTARPLSNKVPEKSKLVRIKDYKQTWTVEPIKKGVVHVTFEGSVNPGGSIPSWLYNMVVTETPMKMLNSLREKAVSGRLADN